MNRQHDKLVHAWDEQFGLSATAVMITDLADGKIIYVNASFERIFGICSADALGHDTMELGLASAEMRNKLRAMVINNGSLRGWPMHLKAADGTVLEVLLSTEVVTVGERSYFRSKMVDVTDMQLQEDSIAQLAAIVDYSDIAIIALGLDQAIKSWNTGAQQMFGFTAAEVIGQPIDTIIPPECRAMEAGLFARVQQGEQVAQYETVRIRKNGDKFHVALSVSALRDRSGSIVGISKITRDITEQKQATYTRSLIEVSLDPLVTISAAGKITDVNQASVHVTGVGRDQLIGTDFSVYFTDPQRAQAGYEQVFEKGFVADYPLTIRHTDGHLTDVLYNAAVYRDADGTVLGVFAAARDVTLQKQASQYARSLLEASLDPLVTIDALGKIMDVNEASILVTGYTRGQLIGTDFSDYFTEPDKAQAGYEQVFEKGFVADYPLTIRHTDGHLTDVMYNASVYKNAEGIVLGVFAAARDVTEQKWAIDLRIANKELAFQNNEKEKRADELVVANAELAFQNAEKEKRADELVVANAELAFQNAEKEKRAAELALANAELAFQSETKERRAAELVIANGELAYQNGEKEKRAAELVIANEELAYQSKVKERRAAELVIANKELVYQNQEKEKRATELALANEELAYQNAEKEKRAAELAVANIELAYQNDEKGKRVAELRIANYARSLIEASRDPLVTINAEGKITDMNEATVRITGIAREQLIGSDFFGYFTEPQEAREVYQEVFAMGSVADSPLTLRHTDGKLTDVLFNGSVYKDHTGTVQGVVIVARDVTERNKAEANIAKNLQEISGYKLALDESSIVAITDRRGIINYANDNFCKISGYSREELIGSDHRLLNSGFHSTAFMADIWATISSGKIWNGEIKNLAKDGSIYWVDTTIVPFVNAQGEVYQYVAIRHDITARKLLLQYSISLIEASRDPLVTISPEGKITDMNEAMVTVTGRSRADLRGSDFKDYFTDPQKASEVYQEVFEKGFVTDYPLTIVDHKLTVVLFNGSVYKDDTGNVVGAVIVARDITDRNRIQKELTEAIVVAEMATELAEQARVLAEHSAETATNAVKAKQQFLSNMSHEIRTPMNAIIGFTKVLLKTELSSKQKEYLSAIKTSGDALVVLINDILDLAKVDAGKMTFEHTPFKLSASISAMLHLFEPKIQEKNLALEIEYDDRIPEVLLGDAVRLHQIIMNLVSNAVKFTNHGKITVRVLLREEDATKVKVEMAVIDTGIGIIASKIDTIFENFQQATSSTSRLFGGTGLGLAIVKQLVEQQGGTISVSSQLDQGSAFSFTLTFEKTQNDAAAMLQVIEMDPDFRNIKVLVVEDMPLNQLLMRTLLDDFGFERDIAANGQIAIEKLQSKTFDIVLMDLQMPVMNGFEATAYIRNTLRSKIPIIALTADVTTMDLAKCTEVGMDDYIAKPVDERLLYSKILSHVKKPTVQVVAVHSTSAQALEEEVHDAQRYTDLANLMKRTKANPDLMAEMISIYLEQTPPLITAMRQGLKEQDWQGLQAAVHKMIPSFSIMGIDSEYELMAKKIQEYATAQQQTDAIHGMVAQLGRVCEQALLELEEDLRRIRTTK